MAEDPSALIGFHGETQRTALSQIGLATFGDGAMFFLLQGFTAAILMLAANTAFNGFPVPRRCSGGTAISLISWPTAATGSCSRTGSSRWPRWACVLIVAFNANVTRLIQLYILGVFLSFTLSQAGMVKHWAQELRGTSGGERRVLRRKQLVNGTGAVATGVVFVIVLVTKFAAGAWIVVLAAPVIFMVMKAIAASLPAGGGGSSRGAVRRGASRSGACRRAGGPTCWRPTLRALAFAQASGSGHHPGGEGRRRGRRRPASCRVGGAWRTSAARGDRVALPGDGSPRSAVTCAQLRRDYPGDVISIIIPEYVVGHWWQNLLHNQTALRLKARLLFEPWITVTSVPWVSGAPER